MTQAREIGVALPRLLTEEQAAEMLNIPIAALRKIVTRARVRVVGRYTRYDRLALESYVDELSGQCDPRRTNEPINEDDADVEALSPIYQEPARRPPRAKAPVQRAGG